MTARPTGTSFDAAESIQISSVMGKKRIPRNCGGCIRLTKSLD